ncbi:MAG: hypothetical protein ABSB40_02000 [Nitrososphaeria archaeon]|jgi:esterase/lipase
MRAKPEHKGNRARHFCLKDIADICRRYNYAPKHQNIVSLVSIASSQQKIEENKAEKQRKDTKDSKDTNIGDKETNQSINKQG